MQFRPLGRSDETGLLGIPGREDDGALGPPPARRQSSYRARFFHEDNEAADRVAGAVDPGIVMVAANDPLVGKLLSLECRDDVIGRFEVPIERELQSDACRTRTHVIGDGEPTAPRDGRHGRQLEERADELPTWASP